MQIAPPSPAPTSPAAPSEWRSLLFLPQFAFPKAPVLGADCFILDLQDAVPLHAKAGARKGIAEAMQSHLFRHKNVVVRINEAALADELTRDLEAIVGLPDLLGLMPTMVERATELDLLADRLSALERARGLAEGTTRLLPLIETPAAVLGALDLARAGKGRLIGLLLGAADLLRLSNARGLHTLTLDFPRNAVVYAARAAGIEPFDTPFLNVDDPTGLERDARAAKHHGFTGKAAIHPSQLTTLHRLLMPSPSETEWSTKVVQAQQDGALARLIDRTDELPLDGQPRPNDGMALVDGRLVGPPHIKSAKRILARTGKLPRARADGLIGRVVPHRVDAEIIPALELPNPYELTLTSGWRDLWNQSFYSHDRTVTSLPFAHTLGLGTETAAPIPFTMALYLTCCMSSTHGAIYHLGFRDARQHAPVRVGDTFQQRIRIKSVRNTGDGDRAVVRTSRELVRVPDGEVVFTLDKLELYRRQPRDIAPTEAQLEAEHDLAARAERFRSDLLARAANADLAPSASAVSPLATGDLLLHSFARPLGISANLALSTLFLVTHPIHLDHAHYDSGEGLGIVVSGGLVLALTVASAARDLHEVLTEELLSADNIRPVAPTETVGALTFVLDRHEFAEKDSGRRFEALTLRTLGVKGLTPSRDLAATPIPRALLQDRPMRPSDYDRICREDGARALEGRIVTQVTRQVFRALPG